MTRNPEKDRKIKAGVTTVAINALILLIMIFAAAWQTPGSGPGDYPGIEVNLGYDDQGSGNIEPATPIGQEEAISNENPPADPEVDESQPETAAPEAVAEETKTTTPVEEAILTDPNSDVEIKEDAKEKPVEKTVEKESPVIPDKPVDKPLEKPVEKPKLDNRAVYQGKNSNTSTPGAGDAKQGTAGNQGDDVGKEGNKGVPGGTEGAAVYKGRPGGGDGGTGLDLAGWDWDYIPKPNIPDNQTGRIVFEIEVDENGELIRYRKESGTVTAAAERACIEAIQKLTFTKKSGAKVPQISKGRITFVIRAQ